MSKLLLLLITGVLSSQLSLAALSSESAGDDEDDIEEEVIGVNPFTEGQRLKGFFYHQEFNKKFDQYRESGVGKVKSSRASWESMMAATVPEYKQFRAQQKRALDESSPEYKRDLAKKDEFTVWLEAARKRYVKARDLARIKRNKDVKLSEAEEYDLLNLRERVEITRRDLYFAKGAKPKSGGTSTTSSSGGDYTPSTPAPPPPPMGDFYEPDIPPPPPMPMDGGFDDGIPPPIFDEPEF